MPVIDCPKCNHNALWIEDSVLYSKHDGDMLESKDFRVILSWPDQNFIRPETGSRVICHHCGGEMMSAIQSAFRRMKKDREREWDL
jgi:hypothetical protein